MQESTSEIDDWYSVMVALISYPSGLDSFGSEIVLLSSNHGASSWVLAAKFPLATAPKTSLNSDQTRQNLDSLWAAIKKTAVNPPIATQ